MILWELIFAFTLFVSITYSIKQKIFFVLNSFFSFSIASYLALIFSVVLLEGGVSNEIQILFIFYFILISFGFVIKYSIIKLLSNFQDSGANYLKYYKTLSYLKLGNIALYILKIFLSFLFTVIVFFINLGMIFKISSNFVNQTSGSAVRFLVEQNTMNLFNIKTLSNDENEEMDFFVSKLQNTNLDINQIQTLFDAFKLLEKEDRIKIKTEFLNNHNKKSFVFQIIANYLKIYPLLNQDNLVEIYKIDDIRNTILYGKDYIKLNKDSSYNNQNDNSDSEEVENTKNLKDTREESDNESENNRNAENYNDDNLIQIAILKKEVKQKLDKNTNKDEDIDEISMIIEKEKAKDKSKTVKKDIIKDTEESEIDEIDSIINNN